MPDMSKIRLKETEYWFKDKAARDIVGNLDDLTTQNKDSIVGAINELNDSCGESAVLYTEQNLMDEEQRQARDNIGVGSTIADTLIDLKLVTPLLEDDGEALSTADGTILVLGGPETPFVKTINGMKPDADGNVSIALSEQGGLVTSVNGMTGDVVLECGSGGGVTSWNDLEDKPFYEINKTVTETWNYLIDGHEYITAEAITGSTDPFLVKISDAIVDLDTVSGGYHETMVGGITETSPFEEWDTQSFDVLSAAMTGAGIIYFAPEGTHTVEGLTLTGGIWVQYRAPSSDGEYETIVLECANIKQLDEKFIPDTIARKTDCSQSDMAQTDETAPDYVKNKTHWTESGTIDILKETTMEFGPYDGTAATLINRRVVLDARRLNVLAGREDGIISAYCDVNWNGQTYYSVHLDNYIENETRASWAIGDSYLASNPSSADRNYPFYILRQKDFEIGRDEIVIWAQGTDEDVITLSIVSHNGTAYNQLDERFIPDSIARKHDIITDWNELMNAPFEKEVVRTTLTYDGNIEGRDYASIFTESNTYGVKFYKVSDSHLPDNISVKGTVRTGSNGANSLMSYDAVHGDGIVSYGMVVDVLSTTFTLDGNTGTAPSTGIYFWGEAGVGNGHCSSFTYEATKITLKHECVPDGVATGGSSSVSSSKPDWNQNDPEQPDYVKNRTHWVEGSGATIEWDGDTDGKDFIHFSSTDSYLYKVSDLTPSMSDLADYSIVEYNPINGIEKTYNDIGLIQDETDNYINCINIGSWAMIISDTEFSVGGTPYTAPSTGVYFTHTAGGGLGAYTKSLTWGNVVVHPMDAKFLPKLSPIPDATGETVTAAEFNALLAALRNAGYLAT